MTLLLLFWEFFKAGLFAVGGGLSTLPFLDHMADSHNWLSHAQISNVLAISEATPGLLGVNLAAFTGFQVAGVPGSIVATLALILAPAILTIAIARGLSRFREHHVTASVLAGLRPAAAGLLAAVAFTMLLLALYNGLGDGILHAIKLKELVLFAVLLPLVMKFQWHPLVYIGAAGAVGIILQLQ